MQSSVLIRQSGHTVHPDKVCQTVSCMHTHPIYLGLRACGLWITTVPGMNEHRQNLVLASHTVTYGTCHKRGHWVLHRARLAARHWPHLPDKCRCDESGVYGTDSVLESAHQEARVATRWSTVNAHK